MIFENSSQNFVLVDNVTKLNKIVDFTSKQIITFDYQSHIFLKKHNISHIVSDDFHSIEELQKLENFIYHFVCWYEIPAIKNIIFENDINLGELFYVEFRAKLTSFLKKYIEISNLIKLYPNAHYFVSKNMYDIVSTFTTKIEKISIEFNDFSIYDSIDVPLKLGSKQITLKLSTKQTSKIQNFLNKLCRSFLLNKTVFQDHPNILVVNFSTIKHKNFLLEIPNFKLNVIKYDRTIPSIWNKHSLDIIKNSNCILENDFTLLDKFTQERIKKNEQIFLLKLDSVFLSKELESHFSLNQLSFWDAIKPLFFKLCKEQFLKAAKEIELSKNLLKKYSFSKILFTNESGMAEQIILKLANQQKIPTYTLQHGLYCDTSEMISENKFHRLLAKNSDYLISWGNTLKNYAIKNNINYNKIISLGSIFFDYLFQNKITTSNNSEIILLASDPLAFYRIIDHSIIQKEKYEKTITQICKTVFNNNKKLIIKTHPQKNQYEYEISKKIDPSIKVFHSGNIHSMIKSSDLVIVTDITTVILESMIMQKPVISIRMKEHYGKPEIFNYCPQINLNELDEWLDTYYNNSEIKSNLIKKGNEFLKIYFKNFGNASKEVLKFLEKS